MALEYGFVTVHEEAFCQDQCCVLLRCLIGCKSLDSVKVFAHIDNLKAYMIRVWR